MSTPPELVVRGVHEVKVSYTTDLVEFYRKVGAAGQAEYWEQDLDGAEEWERPISYLCAWLDDGMWVDEPSRSWGIQTFVDWDWGLYVAKNWSPDRYEMLLAEVPWMRPPPPEDPMEREDLARMPGPADVPLFNTSQETW